MQVVEVHVFGFSDPVLAALSIAGIVGIVVFVLAAVMRLRGNRTWDRAFLVGGILLAVAFVGTLLYLWVAASPGEAVAARIRASNAPEIGRVVFRAKNYIDPEETDVWLVPGATEADADRVWCDVIVPAGGSQGGDNVVVVWNATGTSLMAIGPACQPGTSGNLVQP